MRMRDPLYKNLWHPTVCLLQCGSVQQCSAVSKQTSHPLFQHSKACQSDHWQFGNAWSREAIL